MTSIETIDPLQKKYFGDLNSSDQIVLHVPHAVGGSFLEKHPDFLELFDEADRPYVQDYLEVEHDFGALQLAESIARYLETRLKIRIVVTSFTLPRGADDFNRVEEKAIPKIFSENHQEYAEKILTEKFRVGTQQFEKILENNTVIYAEIHSMASFCLKSIPKSVRGNLSQVINGWNDPKNRKKERDICFVTTLLGQGRVADFLLTSFIKTELDQHFENYEGSHSDDSPYVSDESKRSHIFMKKTAGVCPDVPKHYLSIEQPENEGFHLARLTPDDEKIDHLGKSIGKGIEKSYHNKDKKHGISNGIAA